MTKPAILLQELQARIGDRAKSDPAHRFWGIYVHIVKVETLEASYLQAKQQQGSAGSDGVTFADIERAGRQQFLQELHDGLRDGTYRALPQRKVEIPKAGGKTRIISVGAIRDRVVQGAARLILEPIFEADFSNSSMGSRRGRRAHQAITRVRRALHGRRHYVVDVDLASFFDNIAHPAVLRKVAQRVQDRQVLAYVKWFLKGAGRRGVPQGSPLSPLLANLVLTDLDNALDRGKGFIEYVRYLDDMVVLAFDSPKGRKWADCALQRIRSEAAVIGVSVNEEKTRQVTMTSPDACFVFLGFEFRWKRGTRSGKPYAHLTPRKEKLASLKERVRAVLRHNRHIEVSAVVKQLNPILRGWLDYFRIGHAERVLLKLRNYVELRVRRFAAKQRKRQGFGWKRWSREVVYRRWGLYDNYRPKADDFWQQLRAEQKICPV